MIKFFPKKPKICSICLKEKIIYKSMKKGLTSFDYCKECYDEYYKKIEGRTKQQVMEAVKSGRKIGMKEALEITKKVTAEIEAENEVNKNGKEK
jgi:hypothetical protein